VKHLPNNPKRPPRGARAWLAALAIAACGNDEARGRGDLITPLPPDASMPNPIQPPHDSGSTIVSESGPPDPASCKNLQCIQVACEAGTTTITGTVYAPNGTLPLYNVLVYVPNAPVPAVTQGLTCDRCGGIPPGEPVAAALTDSRGVFQIKNAPAGKNIPLVMQVGKWRRQIAVPEVVACQDNKLTDPQQTRLPKNRSEGDMPHIAITTGGCDNLVCLLPKLGIDPGEYGIAGDDKRVIFYAGNDYLDSSGNNGRGKFGANLARMTDASALWGNPSELMKYDMAIFSCECDEYSPDRSMAPLPPDKTPAAFKAVTDYLSAGGRVFGTDYQYAWYKYSTDPKLAAALDIQGGAPVAQNPVVLDVSFPKGKALADWRTLVEPASTYGQVVCEQVWDNITGDNAAEAQVWGSSTTDSAPTTHHPRFVTINTPAGVPVEQQCGRAVHLDAHITTSLSHPINSYPSDCGTNLANGEQVLAFFFYDVASCIQDDKMPPIVPPIVK
jgi:hypothetical protein